MTTDAPSNPGYNMAIDREITVRCALAYLHGLVPSEDGLSHQRKFLLTFMNLVARVLTVCLLAATIAGVASAAPIRYVLVGVQFEDGGTATDSFDFDPVTGKCSNVFIATTNGATRTGATYRFVCGQDVATCNVVPPNSTQVLWLTSTAGNQTGLPAFAIFFTGVTATNGLGTSDLFDISNSSLNVGAAQEAACIDFGLLRPYCS